MSRDERPNNIHAKCLCPNLGDHATSPACPRHGGPYELLELPVTRHEIRALHALIAETGWADLTRVRRLLEPIIRDLNDDDLERQARMADAIDRLPDPIDGPPADR